MRMTRGLAAGALMVAAVYGCGGGDDGPTDPGGNNGPSVAAGAANLFVPNQISIARGASVTWVFGAVDHNVTFGGAAGAPSDIGPTRNDEVSRTFNTAGTFPYTCTLHPGMSGQVAVSGTNQTTLY